MKKQIKSVLVNKLAIKSLQLLTLILMVLLGAPKIQGQDSFGGMIVNENAIIALCGELNYKRQRRDCLNPNVTDLKTCLQLDKLDPLFVPNEEKTYNCVNSSYSGGADIIRDMLEQSEDKASCLSENIRAFYEEIIESPDFIVLSREFEKTLGITLKLNYAIDTRDSITSLEIDLSQLTLKGVDNTPINISISSFSNQAPCQRPESRAVLNKVTEHLTRLSMINSRQKYDPIDEDEMIRPSSQVFDAARFSRIEEGSEEREAEDLGSSTVNTRSR